MSRFLSEITFNTQPQESVCNHVNNQSLNDETDFFGDKDLQPQGKRLIIFGEKILFAFSWRHFVALSSWDLLRSFRNQLDVEAQEGSQLSLFDGGIKRKVGKLTQNFFVNFSLTLLLWTLQLFISSKRSNIAEGSPQNLCVIVLTYYLSDTFNRGCYRFDLLFI